MAETTIVYQVINLDRQELFFGTTDIHLEKEMLKLAKDRMGPTREWQKGDSIHWRPLTDLLEPSAARRLHREFEQHTPPNRFKVIRTFVEEESA